MAAGASFKRRYIYIYLSIWLRLWPKQRQNGRKTKAKFQPGRLKIFNLLNFNRTFTAAFFYSRPARFCHPVLLWVAATLCRIKRGSGVWSGFLIFPLVILRIDLPSNIEVVFVQFSTLQTMLEKGGFFVKFFPLIKFGCRQ